MSHVTTIDPHEHYELPALKQMCRNQGWEFVENQKTFQWYNGAGECEHAIRIPGAKYEIGVVREGNKWQLLHDEWYSGGLREHLYNGESDKNAGLLKQAYGIAKAQLTCVGKSWSMGKVQDRPGWQKMTVTMM
jgi:hypothetical protein